MDLFITHALLSQKQNQEKEEFTASASSQQSKYNWVFWVQVALYIVFFFVAAFLSWWLNGLFEYGTGEKVLYAFLSGFMSYWYLVYVVLVRRDLLQLLKPTTNTNAKQIRSRMN